MDRYNNIKKYVYKEYNWSSQKAFVNCHYIMHTNIYTNLSVDGTLSCILGYKQASRTRRDSANFQGL